MSTPSDEALEACHDVWFSQGCGCCGADSKADIDKAYAIAMDAFAAATLRGERLRVVLWLRNLKNQGLGRCGGANAAAFNEGQEDAWRLAALMLKKEAQ